MIPQYPHKKEGNCHYESIENIKRCRLQLMVDHESSDVQGNSTELCNHCKLGN